MAMEAGVVAMSGQLPVDTPGTDPHTDHYLQEGPTRLNTTQWAGICDWSLEEIDPERIPLTCPGCGQYAGCGQYVDVIPCETGEWVIEQHGGRDATP
jgi:hypothetical protein